MFPEQVRSSIDCAVPSTITHVGFALSNLAGDTLLVGAAQQKGGSPTFPRAATEGRPASGAIEACLTGVGVKADSVYPLSFVWATQNSRTIFFAGINYGAGEELPDGACWFSPLEAAATLEASPHMSRRARDLAVLESAGALSLSPHRRILFMVRELHILGFERLRALPGLSASGGYWRCSVLPVTCAESRNGARIDQHAQQRLERLLHRDFWHYTYSSGQGQEPFGWRDARFDAPSALAEKFIDRSRDVAMAGWGADPAYVEWYSEILHQLEPNGLFGAYADYDLPTDRLCTLMTTRVAYVPLPPPGNPMPGDEVEWNG